MLARCNQEIERMSVDQTRVRGLPDQHPQLATPLALPLTSQRKKKKKNIRSLSRVADTDEEHSFTKGRSILNKSPKISDNNRMSPSAPLGTPPSGIKSPFLPLPEHTVAINYEDLPLFEKYLQHARLQRYFIRRYMPNQSGQEYYQIGGSARQEIIPQLMDYARAFQTHRLDFFFKSNDLFIRAEKSEKVQRLIARFKDVCETAFLNQKIEIRSFNPSYAQLFLKEVKSLMVSIQQELYSFSLELSPQQAMNISYFVDNLEVLFGKQENINLAISDQNEAKVPYLLYYKAQATMKEQKALKIRQILKEVASRSIKVGNYVLRLLLYRGQEQSEKKVLEALSQEQGCVIKIKPISKERDCLFQLEEVQLEDEKEDDQDILALSIEKASMIDKQLLIAAKDTDSLNNVLLRLNEKITEFQKKKKFLKIPERAESPDVKSLDISFYGKQPKLPNWQRVISLFGLGYDKTELTLQLESQFSVVFYCWQFPKARGVMIYGLQLRQAFLEVARLMKTINLIRQEIKVTGVIGHTLSQSHLDKFKKSLRAECKEAQVFLRRVQQSWFIFIYSLEQDQRIALATVNQLLGQFKNTLEFVIIPHIVQAQEYEAFLNQTKAKSYLKCNKGNRSQRILLPRYMEKGRWQRREKEKQKYQDIAQSIQEIIEQKFKSKQSHFSIEESDFSIIKERPQTWSETTPTQIYLIRRLPGCVISKQLSIKLELEQNCTLLVGSVEAIEQAKEQFKNTESNQQNPQDLKRIKRKAKEEASLNQLLNNLPRDVVHIKISEVEAQRLKYERELTILEENGLFMEQRLMFRSMNKETSYFSPEVDQQSQQEIWRVIVTKRAQFQSGEFMYLEVPPKVEGEEYADLVEWEESGRVEIFREPLTMRGWEVLLGQAQL